MSQMWHGIEISWLKEVGFESNFESLLCAKYNEYEMYQIRLYGIKGNSCELWTRCCNVVKLKIKWMTWEEFFSLNCMKIFL